MNERVPLVYVLHALAVRCRPRPLAALQQVKAFYQHQKILSLLTRVGVEAHPAVFGRLYRRKFHAAGGAAERSVFIHLLSHIRVDGQRDDAGFGYGEVNVTALPCLMRQCQSSHNRRGSVCACREIRHPPAGLDRRLVGTAPKSSGAALGLDGEFRPRSVSQRAVSAVRSDGADHQMRKLPGEVYFLGFSGRKVLHHDVSSRQETLDVLVLRFADDRPLGGIQIAEEGFGGFSVFSCFAGFFGRGRCGRFPHPSFPRQLVSPQQPLFLWQPAFPRQPPQPQLLRSRPSSHRVAVWPLHLHHIGPAVGQQLRGIRASDVRREIQHPHAG